ncbi:hypothetical protein PPYR_10909 [Photinus pyralis]|uniref:Single domain-containing protein n=2 Tax=Photinus pyralis TaxID=7054 RepID=A0A5N4AI03_PHOPY|nr:uncharacterized protein LOC116173395 [Photinus pyralis]KAB0796848.1 hypothetical protein PPYR_10909 [Photinus pyralis]
MSELISNCTTLTQGLKFPFYFISLSIGIYHSLCKAMLKCMCFVFSLMLLKGLVCSPHHSHDHTDHCHVQSKSGVIHIDVGQTVSIPRECMGARCEKNVTVTELQCMKEEPKVRSSNCTLTNPDYTKEFPDCCPSMMCNHST